MGFFIRQSCSLIVCGSCHLAITLGGLLGRLLVGLGGNICEITLTLLSSNFDMIVNCIIYNPIRT